MTEPIINTPIDTQIPTIPPQTPPPQVVSVTKPSLLVPVSLGISVIALGMAGFFGYQYFQVINTKQVVSIKDTSSSQMSPSPAPQNTEAPTPSAPSKTSTLSMTGTLQNYMKANCVPGNPQTLDSSELPVNIDAQAMKGIIKRVVCVSMAGNDQAVQNGFIYIQFDDNKTILIYDDQSQEDGHGGPPQTGFFGEKIFSEGSVRIGSWLQGGDGPQLLGDVSLHLKGEKAFTTKSGALIYANYTSVAIPGSDSNLMALLKPYSKTVEDLDQPEVNLDKSIEEKIINHYFGKQPDSNSVEGKALQDMKNALAAIKAK
jgi:hypothetical protein